MTPTALQSEEALLSRIRKQQLIESLDHMSPIYLEGMKRILTVSADTELISAPAYYHAAVHCLTQTQRSGKAAASRGGRDARVGVVS